MWEKNKLNNNIEILNFDEFKEKYISSFKKNDKLCVKPQKKILSNYLCTFLSYLFLILFFMSLGICMIYVGIVDNEDGTIIGGIIYIIIYLLFGVFMWYNNK